jgi:copper chaperone
MASRTLSVPEVSCEHCKASIEAAVSPLEGVESVEVQIDERTVQLDYDGADTTLATVVTTIEDVGYEVPDQA